MLPMHNPPHPGEVLREDILPALGLTAASLAKRLDCSPSLLSAVMLCSAPISHELAVQLEFAGLGRASHWLAQQAVGKRNKKALKNEGFPNKSLPGLFVVRSAQPPGNVEACSTRALPTQNKIQRD